MLLLACKKDDEPMNAAPTIEAQTFSVAENAGVDAAVGMVEANDDDELTFAITEASRSDAFAINASTGAITVAGALDYETAAAYTLKVQVSDGSLTADAEVTINVTDVNEAPVITAQTAPFSIEENAAAGTAVGTVAATDQDEGDDDLTFAITNGNTNEAFQIDNMGAITVKTPAALDFETTPTFTLTVQVSDDENLSSDAEITVNLTDVAGNEAPIIAAQTFSVTENAASGTVVGTVAATDAEGDNLTFAIINGNAIGNANDAFAISAGTGELEVAGTIDYETTPTYTLTVQVSDGMMLATAVITINVTNVNDNAPVIAAQIFSVAENAANGAAVGTVTATDADGDALTFSITDGNTGNAFAINAGTGAITVAGTLDRNTTQTYTLTVQVSDGTTSAEATVTINVTDAGGNEAPTIAAQTFSVAEDAAANTPVGTVTATDADNDGLTFTITAGNAIGNTGDAFAIGAGTGAITVAGTLDHETTPTYTLTVQVSDGTATANAAVTINVTDVNEAPVVTAQSSPFTVAEDAANGTAVGTVAATDPENNPLTFSITSGNLSDAFTINASTGVIMVAGTLDRETISTYTLTVRASDGSLSGTADFTVNVTDVNEAPVVTAQNAAFTVAENATNGTAVGTVAATDPENDRLTFAITSGNTGNVFNINGTTGAITVAGTLDHETTPTYTLTVRASDASLSDMANFTVNVTDVNEAPTVTAQSSAFTVAENAANGTTVGTAAATDPESDRLTFSITAGNTGNAFAINASSGVITVARALDYETTQTYTLTVRASDGSLSGTANFTVNVTNVNDNAPTIAAQTLSVAENSAAGTTVGTVAATDADGDPLTFSITNGNTGDAFQIANTGIITVKTAAPLDFEMMPTFMLTVQVSDGMTPADGTITINVTNVNESGKRLADKDIIQDTLRNAGNANPLGLWSDGTTMWVVNNGRDNSDDKIFAYTLADGSRDADKDINTLNAAGNNVPIGIWSNGTTLWVSDLVDDKLYAYTLSDGSRDAAKDINLDDANSSPLGLWSDGTTIWVVNNKDTGEGDPDTDDDKIFAYTLANGMRNAAKDINTLNNANNNSPTDLWSDGTTIWVSDRGNSSGRLARIYAYTLSSGTRNASKDINNLSIGPRGLWSNGTTLWMNNNNRSILAFQLEQ